MDDELKEKTGKYRIMERTEEDKITIAPIKVILGKKEYNIEQLCIRDAREWRRQVVKLLTELPKFTKTNSENPDEFADALTELMVKLPDRTGDLFFLYAKSLNRDEIEGIANEAELAKAFEEVFNTAFPLTVAAPKMMARLQR